MPTGGNDVDSLVRVIDLAEKRKAAGHTQAELGELLGMTNVHLSRIETGTRTIPLPVLLDCVALYGPLTIEYRGQRYLVGERGGWTPAPDETAATREEPENADAAIIDAKRECAEAVAVLDQLSLATRRYERTGIDDGSLIALLGEALYQPMIALRDLERAIVRDRSKTRTLIPLARKWAATNGTEALPNAA